MSLNELQKPGQSSKAPLRVPAASIPLYVINGIATIWDAQAAATLHCVHDISGLRVGTLPGVVQQNGFLGLPITLTPEEATLLVRKGVAHLVPVPSELVPPSDQIIAARTAARVARSRALALRSRQEDEDKSKKGQLKFDAAGEKARLKREERAKKRAAAAAAAASAAGETVVENSGDIVATVPFTTLPSLMSGATGDNVIEVAPEISAANCNIFTVVPGLPVHPDLVPTMPEHPPLPTTHFPFPVTVRDAALADTFATLHARGLRMGLGPRFGGEYLIYPGDYLRYHAHFTSQVIVRDDPIRPAELVAWGRLGTGTKKAGLLCCWDDRGRGDDAANPDVPGEVEFYSLEWANFG